MVNTTNSLAKGPRKEMGRKKELDARKKAQKGKLVKQILIEGYIIEIYKAEKPVAPPRRETSKLNQEKLRARFIELFGDDECI